MADPKDQFGAESSCLSLGQMLWLRNLPAGRDSMTEQHSHIDSCPLCREAFEGFKQIGYDDSLKSDLTFIKQSLHEKVQNKKSRPTKFQILLAAAVLLFIGLISTLQYHSGKPKNERLFQEFFTMVPIQWNSQQNDRSGKTLQLALAAYEAGDYVRTASVLFHLLETEPDNRIAHFYLGIIRLGENRSRQAIYHLSMATLESRFFSVANWYLGLAHIQIDQTNRAADNFRSVRGEYQSRSSAILLKLNTSTTNSAEPSTRLR